MGSHVARDIVMPRTVWMLCLWSRVGDLSLAYLVPMQGLLAFQYGGGRKEDPGTQQKSRDRFVHCRTVEIDSKWRPR